jgi:hypothetical protein
VLRFEAGAEGRAAQVTQQLIAVGAVVGHGHGALLPARATVVLAATEALAVGLRGRGRHDVTAASSRRWRSCQPCQFTTWSTKWWPRGRRR